MKQINHPEFYEVDLPRLERELGSGERLAELLACLDRAIEEIKAAPPSGSMLERTLDSYRKKKFHSVLRPPHGMRTDYRLIYRCDGDLLLILGVGKRNPGQPNDIYTILNSRTPI